MTLTERIEHVIQSLDDISRTAIGLAHDIQKMSTDYEHIKVHVEDIEIGISRKAKELEVE